MSFQDAPSGEENGSLDDMQHALICKESGKCSSCDDTDAMKHSLSCFLCSGYFHAVCRDADKDRSGDDVICPRSFFNTFSKVSAQSRPHRVTLFSSVTTAC